MVARVLTLGLLNDGRADCNGKQARQSSISMRGFMLSCLEIEWVECFRTTTFDEIPLFVHLISESSMSKHSQNVGQTF